MKNVMKKVNQSKQKLLNYLENFIESDYFQDNVKILRKKINIPENGYILTDEVREKFLIDGGSHMLFLLPPKLKAGKENRCTLKTVNLSLREIAKKLPFYSIHIQIFLRTYLFYNEALYEILDGEVGEVDLCHVENVKNEIEEFSLMTNAEDVVNIMKEKFENFPIAIKLHPTITQRDLLSYIKNNWSEIKNYLYRYINVNSKIGKLRTRNINIKERDKFIYKHRDLPNKEICNLVSINFPNISGSINEGSVSKIVSLERKRRKEV